uniref:heavy metal translocating P-type ATPase n=1 Tax=Agarivorans sp. TaxID=1872412 RepID=UPI003D0224A6
MSNLVVDLQGLSCGKCVAKLSQAVQSQHPDAQLQVSDDKRHAIVSELDDFTEFNQLVEQTGYHTKQREAQAYQYSLQNVKCGHCVKKIEQAIQGDDPEAELSVDIQQQTLQLSTRLWPSQIEQRLSEFGYLAEAQPETEIEAETEAEVETEASPKTNSDASQHSAADDAATTTPSSDSSLTRLNLSGVTCASCVNTIEQALHKLDKVTKVEINFAERTASVFGEESADSLIKQIEQAGYGASLIEDEQQAQQQRSSDDKREYRHKLMQTGLSLLLAVPLMGYGLAGGAMSVSSPAQQAWWLFVGLVTLLVMWISGKQFFSSAWNSVKHRHANMDTLIALGTGAAWLYSMAVVISPSLFPSNAQHLYFEASVMIIGLINLGKALELKARGKTSSAINQLLNLQSNTAQRLDQDGNVSSVAISELKIGDHLLVRPGDSIPVDGKVIKGTSTVDESMLSGEPIPIEKTEGQNVSAGTINGNQPLVISAEKVGKDTLLAKIVDLVSRAQNSKPPISQLADKVSAVFVPSVMIIAIITALAWYNFGPEPLGVNMLIAACSVLIIACPCALGLATPISTMIGVGKAAEAGGLIRNGEALQNASQINLIILDKTGTITQGKPQVSQSQLHGEAAPLLALIYAMERASSHPLASAMVNYIEQQLDDIPPRDIAELNNLSGLGLSARYQQQDLLLGNSKLMQQQGVELSTNEQQLDASGSRVYFAVDGKLMAEFSISDPVKEDSADAIKALQAQGIKVVMLSGDNQATAAAIAKQTGLDEFHGELLPDDKLSYLKQYQQQGYRVAMVGDGINDAPALAA